MNELDDPMLLRQYLLGQVDDAVRTQIEERLMVDDEFSAKVSVAEEELIEEFLDGELSAEDSERFNRLFLAPPERKMQLKLTRDLRRVSQAKTAASPHPQTEPSQSPGFFSFGWLRFAMAGAAMLLVAFGIWRIGFYQSDTDRGLAQLQAAYRDRRPTESRLSGLTAYAPYSETRSGESRVTDPSALDRASRYFVDATTDDPNDPAAQHGQALLYLAAGDLDRAERAMKVAVENLPRNAQVQNDAGALYLERARTAEEDAKQIIALNDSVAYFNKAIELDPNLLEPRFNRAIAIEQLRNTEGAKTAWREYIERDPNSRWTEEAKQHLEKLERETPGERSAETLERDFLEAFRSRNNAEAERIVSTNRELIRDKYLPTRLSMTLLMAPEERRDELLKALEYNGEIEMKLTGDPFAKEIAHFYRSSPKQNWQSLISAHKSLRAGYRLCLDQDYQGGLSQFENSKNEFLSAGDEFNANIARYAAGYALVNLRRNDDAKSEFVRVKDWARERNFNWLTATALHWLAGVLYNEKDLTAAARTYEDALEIASKIDDRYAVQRNQSQLANVNLSCGLEDRALTYAFAAIKDSDRSETSLRQRFRNLFLVLPILFRAKLYGAAGPAALEVVHIADQLNDKMWAAQSRAFAAIAAYQNGDTAQARRLLGESRQKATLIEAEAARKRVAAFADLRSADLERLTGNLDKAQEFYNSAIEYYDSGPGEHLMREEAHRGLLLTYLAQNKQEFLESQISRVRKLTDDTRGRISDDQQSIGFSEVSNTIYETAAEFEFDQRDFETAFDHVETSCARTLANNIRRKAEKDAARPAEVEQQLGIREIRSTMPAGVQIVQYSVFERRLIIWLISRESFEAFPVAADATRLSELVAQFTKRISDPTSASHAETNKLSKELFELLIEPVHDRLDPARELAIIPNKMLFDLPFAALQDANGSPLITKYRFVHSPSSNVYLLSTEIAAGRANRSDESALAIGNPAFDRSQFKLDYLPNAADEASAVSKLYTQTHTPLLHKQATKAALLRAIQDADVVHFAGHYVALPGRPMSSFLLLASDGDDPSDSELSNSEIADMSLTRIRLMVLAACRSGVEGYYRSEGMAGMSRTMLAAQVPLVVASQWDVDSAATSELMVRFHALRKKDGMTTTAALRKAQLELLNDPAGRFSSPYYWAAFAVYGGHANY